MPGTADIPHQHFDVDANMPPAIPEEPGTDDSAAFLKELLVQLGRSNKRQEELARQNLGLLQEISNRNATHAAAPTTQEHNKVKVNPPTPYDGTSRKFLDFITSLYLVFGADKKTYATVESRIFYALSYMTIGAAGRWTRNIVQDIERGAKGWRTWKEFEDELRQQFEGELKKDDAQLALEDLKQGNTTAEDFFQIFESYSRDAQDNDEALVRLLKRNLHPRLMTAIYNQTPLPKTFKEWKETAIQKDRQWREHQLNVRTSGGFNRGTWGRSGSTGGGANDSRATAAPKTGTDSHATSNHSGTSTHTTTHAHAANAPTSNATGVFGGAGVPMEIDRARGGTAGKFQCYNCHGEGHLARNCPHPKARPQRSTVRMMIQAMTEEDKQELLKELGFQNDGE